jgi:glycosyltransferase involved in cell wall biosynthesis
MSSRPRVLLLGNSVHALQGAGTGLVDALSRVADVENYCPSSALSVFPLRLVRVHRAAQAHGSELVHVVDGRLAPTGSLVAQRLGVPLSATVGAMDLHVTHGRRRLPSWVRRLDLAFITDPTLSPSLRDAAPLLDVTVVPPVAQPLPWPTRRAMSSIKRILRRVRPGRLIVGVPWPADRRDLRWFRDAVIPLVDGGPFCLAFGAPGSRAARLMFGAQNLQNDFAVHVGGINADMIAAISRCVDALVVPSGIHGLQPGGATDVGLALAMGGAPVVTCEEVETRVLAHERNAFVVGQDEREFVSTLSQVLSLPAEQRHALGEEFARYTLRRWTWDNAAEIYGERFAALVGRPMIPAALRAA